MSLAEVLGGQRDWWIETTDVLDGLAMLPDESVQCVVTSPPYFALRDYGTATWEGGDPACDHVAVDRPRADSANGTGAAFARGERGAQPAKQFRQQYRALCGKCGARRADKQIGLEPTPDEYVATMVRVFREVRRVLRRDGVLWLNLGDSYATNPGNGRGGERVDGGAPHRSGADKTGFDGIKTKDLLGIPWMVAFALRADGWYLRMDNVWSKPNPMPESVTDRPTRSHEYLFLFSRSERYFYDAEAIKEESENRAAWVPDSDKQGVTGMEAMSTSSGRRYTGFNARRNERVENGTAPTKRNKRSVWTIAPEPFPEAHFATFPPALVEPCVKAGSSERGCCPTCGAPWRRAKEPSAAYAVLLGRDWADYQRDAAEGRGHAVSGQRPTKRHAPSVSAEYVTTGWAPACKHDGEPIPCIVLDLFNGAGTTGLVACRLGRRYVGLELNPDYAEMACRRIVRDQGIDAKHAAEVAGTAQLRLPGE